MVFIHGGGFTAGGGSDATYEGSAISENANVLVVTLNYRLGALGFLAHSALTAEDPAHPTSGNYGIDDQRRALQWVKDNIHQFGGDPANVTLFGESAGGISVCTHLTAPASNGLFARAIVESGPCTIPQPTLAQAQAQGDQLAMALGCTDASRVLACLRSKTAQEVTMALPLRPEMVLGAGVSWLPTVDGMDIPDQQGALLRAGRFTSMPLIIGTNGDEGTLFLYFGHLTVADDAGYHDAVSSLIAAAGLSASADAVVARYPAASFPSHNAALAQVIADAMFVCPSRRVARAVAAAGAPVVVYHFTHTPDVSVFPGLGSFHTSELPFVFGGSYFGIPVLRDRERPLSMAMMGYWTALATAGDPSSNAAVAWPKYASASDQHLVFDLPIATASGLGSSDCDFWDSNTP
jgi:para-nitrobenzyl esterase